ncbi:SPOR domain-containing protein [Demequina sp. SO4-13]|uniref:SPOR domain-containing protein n=1 Tax=Demequina sp. SO4-13 TaxID=3401027 RepID=UPI003AF744D4
MSPDETGEVEYFFNTRTRMVEKGRVSSWEHLMGPYPTREEAERALEKAERRAEEWDEQDEDWGGKD